MKYIKGITLLCPLPNISFVSIVTVPKEGVEVPSSLRPEILIAKRSQLCGLLEEPYQCLSNSMRQESAHIYALILKDHVPLDLEFDEDRAMSSLSTSILATKIILSSVFILLGIGVDSDANVMS